PSRRRRSSDKDQTAGGRTGWSNGVLEHHSITPLLHPRCLPACFRFRRNRMLARDIMTGNPACCTPDTNLENVAWLMLRNNCGAIPVVDSQDSKKPLGIITDRDITCRCVAQGKNPLELTAEDCM